MKLKNGIVNSILALILLFVVSYQSVHILVHHHHDDVHNETVSHNEYKTFKLKISEDEKCFVCDFKFASFLTSEIFSFNFYFPFKENPYSFSIKENLFFFSGSLFAHRGPPILN